jgi:MFS superfamily sulfate permease-like transporter
MKLIAYLFVPVLFIARFLWLPVIIGVWYFYGIGYAIFWGAILFALGLDSKHQNQTQHKAPHS